MVKNKTTYALVTGAASGLGLELALLLAKDNYQLILVDVNTEALKSAETKIKEQFTNCSLISLTKDLTNTNDVKSIAEEVKGLNVEVLINSAGFGAFGSFHETNWERDQAMLNLHVVGTTYLTKLLIKPMVERGVGKVLNISSLAAFQPGPLMALYYATKAYQLSFSEAIANELKGTGVTVTALCPGPTKTGFQGTVSEDASENKISFNMATAEEVALYGYKVMSKGKSLAIPGFVNKILSALPRILTRNKATAIVRSIQEKNRG